jgi:hypothetical protein
VTTLFGTAEPAELPLIEAVARKKHGWLPFLTVLFLFSYGLMTLLIVEQGQTIESQRALIRELFRDSTELSAVKQRAQRALTQAPLAQHPSTQAPTMQAPSSQADPQVRTQNEAGKQKTFRMPTRPASDLADKGRALITI